MKSSATNEARAEAGRGTASAKRGGWIKFLRVVIYAFAVMGCLVGASLIKTGELSAAFADGTAAARAGNGAAIFGVSLVALFANMMWGTLRWFLRGEKERWGPGRVVGKLIGGAVWRALVVIPLALFAISVVTPGVTDAVVAGAQTAEDFEPVLIESSYDKLAYLDQHLGELDLAEIEEELAGLFLSNVRIDTDASGNVSHTKTWNPLVQDAAAYSSTVTTLNKAKLSSGGNFVVFYTDTGDDAISDEKAAELAEMLEEIIAGYRNNLGLEYQYGERIGNDAYSMMSMQAVLHQSGIDMNILDTAMPVYVVDPYSEPTGTYASYAGRKFGELGMNLIIRLGALYGEETARLYVSTPSFPFINILPFNADSDGLAIVTAHEMGHHYVESYIENTYHASGVNDDFVDETAPNWMAINALPGQPVDNLLNGNHYNDIYLKAATGDKISEASTYYDFDGYPAVAFLENYAEVVPGAREKIMDAVYYGDALHYLYEQAGEGDFARVMTRLAERNLTGDYGGKLYNYTLPQGEELACADFCAVEYKINPAATEYLYFTTAEYLDAVVGFSGGEGVAASVLGRSYDGGWQVLESGRDAAEYTIDAQTQEEYEAVALAVANAGVDNVGNYKVSVMAKDWADLVTTTGEFDFSDLYADLGNGCIEVNTDSLFDNLSNLVDLGGELIGVAAMLGEELEPEEDFSGVRAEYDEAGAEAKAQLAAAKGELAKWRISICGNYIAPGQDFDEVKGRLAEAIEYNLNVYDERDENGRVSVFAGVDLLSRRGRVYALAEVEGDMGLMTVEVGER